MTKNDKITVSPGFGIFFLYAIWVWLCDAADLICYLIGLTQCTPVSRLLVTAMLAGGVYLLRHHIGLRRTKKDVLFYGLALAIILFAAHKGIIIDSSADTNKYHILAQQPGFAPAMHADFAAGDFQMFGFRMAERLFYGFRYFLGYRMGTFFTGVATVVAFAQVRELLHALFGQRLEACRANAPKVLGWLLKESVLAFSVIMVSELILQQGTYMVEAVSIPFALEALYLLLTIRNKPQSTLQMVWFAVMNGLFFACKMTHITYAAPMILLYLLLHGKEVSVKRFATAFVIAFAPVTVTLIYNIVETGNPVFPYFNSLFESPYFGPENFKDLRWGPSNIKELILWPYYSSINPYYRLTEVPNQFVLGTIMYFGVTGLSVLTLVLRKKEDRPVTVLLLTLVLVTFYLWAATTGHSRYFLLGYIFIGVLVVDFLTYAYSQWGRLLRWVVWIPMAILLLQPWVLMESVSGGYEFAWRNSRDMQRVSDNLPYVFNDRDAAIKDETIPQPDLILEARAAFGSICRLLYPDTPVVYLDYLHQRVEASERDEWLTKIGHVLESDVVYEPHFARNNNVDWKQYGQLLTERGVLLETIYWPTTIFDADDDVALAKLTALPEGEANRVLYVDDTMEIAASAEAFQATITMSQWHAVGKPVTFSVIAGDGAARQVVYTEEIGMHETKQVDVKLDLSVFNGPVTLQFVCSYQPETEKNPPRCLIINPETA